MVWKLVVIPPNISQLGLEAVLWEAIVFLHRSERLCKGGHYVALSVCGLGCEHFCMSSDRTKGNKSVYLFFLVKGYLKKNLCYIWQNKLGS